MGDRNQLEYAAAHRERLHGPYLEIGSKDYGSTQDFRALFGASEDYLGVDMASGPGVDLVLNLTEDFESVDEAIGGRRFRTIICLSVMEHCDQPFKMAENITQLLEPGGVLYLCVPFAWKFHGYPSDYWRFTHEGVKKLFSQLNFDPAAGMLGTDRAGDFSPLDTEIGKIAFSSKAHFKDGRYIRGCFARIFRLMGRVGLLGWLFDHPYVMAPSNIYMLGTKEAAK